MHGVFIVLGLGFIAGAIILAVMFAPDEQSESYVKVNGKPLAIEAPPLDRPAIVQVEHVGVWDEVDQHWGEAQWMMAVG
jgi:hypothetical protein